MKAFFLAAVMLGFMQSSQAQFVWVKSDTLQYESPECKSWSDRFFLPNGKYLYTYTESKWRQNEYGTWKIEKDSIHINILYVQEYDGHHKIEYGSDTSFYRCFKLDYEGFPLIEGRIKMKNISFPENILADKLNK